MIEKTCNIYKCNDNPILSFVFGIVCLEQSQKLYVRLFQRKHQWVRKPKIVYDKIAEDLDPFLTELVSKGLLIGGKYWDIIYECFYTHVL